MSKTRTIRATYRMQFTRDFRFPDAEALVPYLHRLGISHLYASPVFQARPGSLSGYDTCDFALVNPELGGEEALQSLVRVLHAHDMGLIVDFVPNHMSAHPQWNLWWRNVLANGPSSPLSEYFDIDWYPANSNLHGKVLLAILGKQYGEALESGDLRVEYCNGEFCLLYGDFNLPLNPRQMKFLLRHRWAEAADRAEIDLAVQQEFESILFQLDHIPGYREAGTDARIQRERETQIAMRRLEDLLQQSPALRRHVESTIAEFNGQPGKPESFDPLHTLLQQQAYRLSYWRTAMHEINYRRFFDINDLIGLRMEYEPLFHAAHARLIEMVENGWVDGIRLDHIDGLLDPQQYLVQLRQALGKAPHQPYIIVEKILARQEWLNAQWPVDGATGYEFLALLNGIWVSEENLQRIEAIYREFCGSRQPEGDAVYHAKRLITSTSMASELNVLAHELNRLSERNRKHRDFTLDGLREALREVVACFPVYRTYISERGFCPSDEMAIAEAIGQAKRRNPTLESSIYEFIRQHLCPVRGPEEAADAFAQRLRFAMKFQQYTSPVQAKGIEDTVFYRYSPLASLNEVGSGPGRRTTTPQEFHDANLARMEHWPDAMLTTATHDTKRGEDARLRIHVLAEMPEVWKQKIEEWSKINCTAKSMVNRVSAPDPADEYLYYQNLIGAWPPHETQVTDALVERIKAFMNKALKEAKVHTSWINPSNEYDAAAEKFIEQTLQGDTSAAFLDSFLPFAEQVAQLGAWSSLSQLTLKLMSPGVVDTYQGGELWDLSLVDPDNRRPVEYGTRQQQLDTLLQGFGTDGGKPQQTLSDLCSHWWTGEMKLAYLTRGLDLRAREPELLTRGRYLPLAVTGPNAEHVVAFAREHRGKVLVVVGARWFASLLQPSGTLQDLPAQLKETWLELPQDAGISWPDQWTQGISDEGMALDTSSQNRRLRVADVLGTLPAMWWVGSNLKS